ncbi:MerR family transcriptional regulator [Gallaecimonas sp. GXIMD4217]|uniref:MerR family transcriptional regulator n=1 Tax=Gallaecimonas sp. GXIMD4217 TaxID=3131927 RepID=UPI00311AF496
MYIGEVAKKTGLSVKAIRFYEEKGLIRAPERLGRYRVYTDAHVEVLRLIVEAKALGVSLARIKGAIRYHNGEVDWQRVNHFLKDLKRDMEAELQRIVGNIERLDACVASIATCPQGA